jgi:hypothetical protein
VYASLPAGRRRVLRVGLGLIGAQDRLTGYGCDLAQGHHIARPMTRQLCQTWLESRADAQTPADASRPAQWLSQ